ncbi:single-stranded DNA-binding protein [Bdellovibrionota bacterium FG-1]
MKDVNKILLIGRLGANPVQRETKNGLAVVHFPLATSRRVAEQGSDAQAVEKEETQWHRVVVWGKQAEACHQYLEKGQAVFVEGMVRTRKYTAKSGEARFVFEVHADHVSFLGRKRSTPANGAQAEGKEVDPSVEVTQAA